MNPASLDQTASRRGRRGQEAGSPPPPTPGPLASFPSLSAELLSAGDPTPGKAACVSSRPGVKPATQADVLTLITLYALQCPGQCTADGRCGGICRLRQGMAGWRKCCGLASPVTEASLGTEWLHRTML